jgi:hypothetical protein
MKKASLIVVVAALLGGGWLMVATWAQERAEPSVALPEGPPTTNDFFYRSFEPPAAAFPAPATGDFLYQAIPRGPFPVHAGRVGMRGHNFISSEEVGELQSMRKAVDSLKSAKTDEDKAKVSKELTQLLAKAFDRDLERREKEVTEIEGRVKKLRDQIERRKKAKEDIVSLWIKTIANEAEGLGFPGQIDAELPPMPPHALIRTPDRDVFFKAIPAPVSAPPDVP